MNMRRIGLGMCVVCAVNCIAGTYVLTKTQGARDEAAKYATPAQIAKVDSTVKNLSAVENIHFYDALAAQGKVEKAYQEGAQMVRDSIAKAAKTAIRH